MIVPIGSSVVIIGLLIKVIAGTSITAITAEIEAAEASAAALETTSVETATGTGIGKGTIIVLGAGAVAVGSGVAIIAANSGDGNGTGDSGDGLFTGTFRLEFTVIQRGDYMTDGIIHDCTAQDLNILTLRQDGTTVTGTFEETDIVENCCTATFQVPITGTVLNETSATLRACVKITTTLQNVRTIGSA